MREICFDLGWRAFQKSHPHLAAGLPEGRHYVCPICLRAGSEVALAQRELTIEHVPPRSVGGRPMVLTCKDCNSTAGHMVDCHLRGEADLQGFADSNVAEMPVVIRTASGRANATLKAGPGGYEIVISPKGFRDSDREALRDDLNAATIGDGWRQFSINVSLPRYNRRRAAVAWLRAAYLVAFAKLGYRYILGSGLDAVRRKLLNPDLVEPSTYRVPWNQGGDPELIEIQEPAEAKGLAMLFPPWLVFLPRGGDVALYDRLATLTGSSTFQGHRLGWPTRPELGLLPEER